MRSPSICAHVQFRDRRLGGKCACAERCLHARAYVRKPNLNVQPTPFTFELLQLTSKMLTPALSTLIYLLYCCLPADVSSKPLIIMVTMEGSDEKACLRGKIPCKTFEYACGSVNGKGGDVTWIITYPQELNHLNGSEETVIYIGHNISSAKIIGQVEGDYTFRSATGTVTIYAADPLNYMSPRLLRFENTQWACPLRISSIFQVEFKGYFSPSVLILFDIGNVTIEESSLAGGLLAFSYGLFNMSMTIKNSSFVNNDTMLHLNYTDSGSAWRPIQDWVEVFMEYVDFKFTPAPSPNQPPYMAVTFSDTSNVNVTVSKCNFFNHNSTILAIDTRSNGSNTVYASIRDSNFYIPHSNFFGDTVRTQVKLTQASVHTRLNRNNIIESG